MNEEGYYELQLYSPGGALIAEIRFGPGDSRRIAFPGGDPPKLGAAEIHYHEPGPIAGVRHIGQDWDET